MLILLKTIKPIRNKAISKEDIVKDELLETMKHCNVNGLTVREFEATAKMIAQDSI